MVRIGESGQETAGGRGHGERDTNAGVMARGQDGQISIGREQTNPRPGGENVDTVGKKLPCRPARRQDTSGHMEEKHRKVKVKDGKGKQPSLENSKQEEKLLKWEERAASGKVGWQAQSPMGYESQRRCSKEEGWEDGQTKSLE